MLRKTIRTSQTLTNAIAVHMRANPGEIAQNNKTWQASFTGFPQQVVGQKSLSEYLHELRDQQLNCESFVVNYPRKSTTRVFPPKDRNILLDTHDVFARGLDSALAVLEISKYVNDVQKRRDIEETLKSALKIFYQAILNAGNDLAKSKKALAEFNGALVSLLVTREVCASSKSAIASINFARDFVWKSTRQNEGFCTIIPVQSDDPNACLIRYTRPMEVYAGDVWQVDPKTQWQKDLHARMGNWFNGFVSQNRTTLDHISPTSMSRFSPNPANAYDSTLIYCSDGQVKQVSNSTHVAITEPFGMKNKQEKAKATLDNQRALFFGKNNERLKAVIDNYFAQWAGVVALDKEVSIPVLHQTLVGDNVLPWPLSRFIPDQAKSSSMLDNKIAANKRLREELASKDIYRTSDGRILIQPKGQFPVSANSGYTKINIELLDTNHCVNMHHRVARVRQNSVNDSHRLIDLAKEQLEKVAMLGQIDKETKEALRIVTQFLDQSNYGIVSTHVRRGKDVKEALEKITQTFKDENAQQKLSGHPSSPIPKHTAANIALLAQSAVELKCCSRETLGGAFRRTFNNTAGQMPVIGPGLRLIGWSVGQFIRGITVIPAVAGFVQWFNHRGTRRKEVHKAVNEQMVAELLGERAGGCMSSADRAEEIEQLKQANLRAFHDPKRGRILGYNDSAEENREFMATYGTTQEKHNFNKMCTGSPTTSDGETRSLLGKSGLMSEEENKDEQAKAKIGALRKGKYKKTQIDRYLESAPALIGFGSKSIIDRNCVVTNYEGFASAMAPAAFVPKAATPSSVSGKSVPVEHTWISAIPSKTWGNTMFTHREGEKTDSEDLSKDNSLENPGTAPRFVPWAR